MFFFLFKIISNWPNSVGITSFITLIPLLISQYNYFLWYVTTNWRIFVDNEIILKVLLLHYCIYVASATACDITSLKTRIMYRKFWNCLWWSWTACFGFKIYKTIIDELTLFSKLCDYMDKCMTLHVLQIRRD